MMPDESVQSSPQTDVLAMPGVMPPPQEQQQIPVSTTLAPPLTPPSLVSGTGGESQFNTPTPSGTAPSTVQLPPRPIGTSTAGQPMSKTEFFRNMLGEFMYSVGKGLSERGTGPMADSRGAGIAMTAPHDLEIQQQQLAIQRENALSAQRYKEAQTQSLTPSIRMVGPDGQEVMVPPAHVGQALAAQYRLAGTLATNKSREVVQETKNVGALDVQALKNQAIKPKTPSDPLWQITKQTNPGLDPNSPEFAQKWEDLRMREKTEPGVKRMATLLQRSFHPFNDAAGNTIGWVNPVTRQVTMGEDIPGLQGVLAQSGGVIPPKPPGQVIGMAVAAGTMLQHMPTINREIDEAAKNGKLGPAAGRWNEFMTGRVGAADPQFTKLRNDVALLQTRLMQAHVGLAGSDKMMEHFAGLINQGYQSPENMKAAMEVIQSYLETYRGMSPQATGGVPAKVGGGKLTETEAMDYLRKAGGDANKARVMAKKDGRTF